MNDFLKTLFQQHMERQKQHSEGIAQRDQMAEDSLQDLRQIRKQQETQRLRSRTEREREKIEQSKEYRLVMLEAENKKLREALERAEGLAKSKILESQGLIATIRHLHKAWNEPGAIEEFRDKEAVKALMNTIDAQTKANPENIAKAEELVEKRVHPNKKPQSPR